MFWLDHVILKIMKCSFFGLEETFYRNCSGVYLFIGNILYNI